MKRGVLKSSAKELQYRTPQGIDFPKNHGVYNLLEFTENVRRRLILFNLARLTTSKQIVYHTNKKKGSFIGDTEPVGFSQPCQTSEIL